MPNSELIGIGVGAASGIASGLLGINAGQQAAQQQFNNQIKLNEHMAQLQRENWDYTNAENQRKHYEKAGLNVGLMYGGGGAGGATMGGGSGGSAGMAPQYAMGIGLDPMTLANIDLAKAQTEKLKAEATKIGGVDTTLIQEGIKGAKLANMFNDHNMNTALNMASQEYENEVAKNRILINEGKITGAEAENRDNGLKASIANTLADTILKKSTNEQVKANTEKIKEETSIIFKDYLTRAKNADTNQKAQMYQDYRAEMQQKLQERGLDQQETKMWIDGIIDVLGLGVSATQKKGK